MSIQLSDYLNVEPSLFDEATVFNGFVDLDSKLHVDPKLMLSSAVPEMQSSYEAILEHFRQIIKLVDASAKPNDAFWNEAVKRLTFPETHGIFLGYADDGNDGRGIGPTLADTLLRTANELITAGIRDPELFELVGLIQNNIGADRISDMVIHISRKFFYQYTARVAEIIKCETSVFEIDDVEYILPNNPSGKGPLLFVPSDVLRDLPMAQDWSDVDYVCSYNTQARAQANRIIGVNWKQASEQMSKEDLKSAVLQIPQAFMDLIEQYRAKNPEKYDFAKDPLGELLWFDISRDISKQFPLKLDVPDVLDLNGVVTVVRQILDQIKQLVENNNLWELIFDRKERHAQRLVYGIAKSYCDANGIDISPEVNSGPGPVDFKFSLGADAKVLVEVKLSTNSSLLHGYEKQLEIYNAAEQSGHSFFLIFLIGNVTKSMRTVRDLNSASIRIGESVPELYEIDSLPKDSASVR